MTLKTYLENLTKLVKENPKSLDYMVVCSSDDEGNSYESIYHKPSVGKFNNRDREFVPEDNTTEFEPDAVCIN